MTFPASPQYTVWASSTLQGIEYANKQPLVRQVPVGHQVPLVLRVRPVAIAPTPILQLQWVSGAVVTNDTAWFAYSAPFNGTVNSLIVFLRDRIVQRECQNRQQYR